MPNQVYRFDPVTGAVRVVADGFDRCNGIAFTKDGKTAYMCASPISAFINASRSSNFLFSLLEQSGHRCYRRLLREQWDGASDLVRALRSLMLLYPSPE
jgi:hypothetical protein